MMMLRRDNAAYFEKLNKSLLEGERALPRLLIDLDRLDYNIDVLRSQLSSKAALRLVVKSLPSTDLIKYLMDRTSTRNLMVFHQPFLSDIASWDDGTLDILVGKPMPIKTATYFYNNLPNGLNSFDPLGQVQWLIDTPERLTQYIALARKLDKPLRLNLEIDVGLHRGGFSTIESLSHALDIIIEHTSWVSLSGMMGYDPHVVKLPRLLKSQESALHEANHFYQQCISLVRDQYPSLWNEKLTFNGAGSPTFALHNSDQSPLNDISVGSAFLKPTTFDIATLSHFQEACYIATPILKKMNDTTIPGLEKAKGLLSMVNKSNRRSYFIYGGYWKADYCYPPGLQQNTIFGPSTNQTMLNAPIDQQIEVDDFIFLRPHQSEFVLLQFGELLTVRNGEIGQAWRLLSNE